MGDNLNTGTKRKKIDMSKMSSLLVFVAICVVLSIMSPHFLTANNLINVATQVTVNALVSVGMTFVIITGGIDLSVGSIIAASAMTMGMLMKSDQPVLLAVIAGLAVGTLIGAINGVLVTLGKLPPFIATMGMMNIARAAALIMSGGATLSSFPRDFFWLGIDTIPMTPIPVQVVIMIAIYFLAFYILRYRKMGRYIYAIGGNKEATRLSGINTKKYEFSAYAISGLTASVAGMILAAKLNAAQPTAGEGYELNAVAATVIGGASLSGGVGSIWGTLIGALIIGVIRNGMNLMNADSYWQTGIIGGIIIVAVLVDGLRKKD